MGNVNLPVRMAPETLQQSILPGWQFSLFSVDLGHSTDPDIEKVVIDRVGSYGKQLGHLAEALEVVIKELGLLNADNLEKMSVESQDAIKVFMSDVSKTKRLKSHTTRV